MNHWSILRKTFLPRKGKPHFASNVYCNSEAEIIGEIFVGGNTNIGKSMIISKSGSIIVIGKDTNIREKILILADESSPGRTKNIFIGNKVFISSYVEIYGPSLISDETFIGNKTMIVGSNIGRNCLIEDNVIIKNISIPPNLVIPSRAVVDSLESLNEIIQNFNQESCCEVSSKGRIGDLPCF